MPTFHPIGDILFDGPHAMKFRNALICQGYGG
jgi:hypothetical protein